MIIIVNKDSITLCLQPKHVLVPKIYHSLNINISRHQNSVERAATMSGHKIRMSTESAPGDSGEPIFPKFSTSLISQKIYLPQLKQNAKVNV